MGLHQHTHENITAMRCYIGLDALFFCKIACQMSLPQHTHDMTRRCVAIVGFDALFFCKIVARWVYKEMCLPSDAFAFEFVRLCSFVKSLQDGFTSTHA
jgi:hypothetical protein